MATVDKQMKAEDETSALHLHQLLFRKAVIFQYEQCSVASKCLDGGAVYATIGTNLGYF